MAVEWDDMLDDAACAAALSGSDDDLGRALAGLGPGSPVAPVLSGLRGIVGEIDLTSCLRGIAAQPGGAGWRAMLAYQVLARSSSVVLAGMQPQELDLFASLCRTCAEPLFSCLPGLVARAHVRANCGGVAKSARLPAQPGSIPALHLLALRGEAGERLRHHREGPQATAEAARLDLLGIIDDLTLGELDGLGVDSDRFEAILGPEREIYDLLLPCAWLMQALLAGVAISRADAETRLVHLDGLDQMRRQQVADLLRLPWAQAEELEPLARRGHDLLTVSDDWDLLAWNQVRAAILRGHIDRAADLLTLRARHLRSTGALDHLFWARILLLDGDGDKAAGHYRNALLLAEENHSLGRLEFELRLSRELGTVELTRLLLRTATVAPTVVVAAAEPELVAQAEGDLAIDAESGQGSDDVLLLGRSKAMVAVRARIETFAAADLPVLILGETGTGKDLAARAIHLASLRRQGPFIAVNCAAFTDSLLESELFGHLQGSYTGASGRRQGLIAAAEQGSLFLDEIADTSPLFQAALLRLLENFEYRPVGSDQSFPVRCRILAASNVDLDHAVRERRFRADLLYRLQRLQLVLPPLSERVADIPLLAQHFLNRHGRGGRRIAPALAAHLQEQDWPGNVRHLRNRIELLAVSFPGERVLEVRHLEEAEQDHTTSWHRRVRPEQQELASSSTGPGRALERRDAHSSGPLASLGQGNPQMARLEQIRGLFRQHRRLTRQQVMQSLGISQSTATSDLKQLCLEGLVEKVQPTPAPRTHYFRMKV